jgi:hypothetical protein
MHEDKQDMHIYTTRIIFARNATLESDIDSLLAIKASYCFSLAFTMFVLKIHIIKCHLSSPI